MIGIETYWLASKNVLWIFYRYLDIPVARIHPFLTFYINKIRVLNDFLLEHIKNRVKINLPTIYLILISLILELKI